MSERSPLLADILNQARSQAEVAAYQLGPGAGAINTAAAQLASAPLVVLTGIGASLHACIPLGTLLAAQGLPVVVVDASELLHYYLASYRNAVVVVVSRSGESVEIIRLADELKRQGTAVIAVTCEPASSLARTADHALRVNSAPDDFVAIQSYAGTLLVLYLLGAAVIKLAPSKVHATISETTARLGETIDHWHAAGQHAFEFLRSAGTIYLLGRGASLASAHQGALLFNEVSKLPTTAMSAGHFRHGPVEVMDSAARAIVFVGGERTHALNVALAHSLVQVGARVRIVGSGLADDGIETWRVPNVLDALRPILEIVPLQFAAYHLAQWRGIPRGEFRFVSRVTRSEKEFARSGELSA